MEKKTPKRPNTTHDMTRDFIVLQQYAPSKSSNDTCHICKVGTAQHTIRFYDNLRESMRLSISGVPQALVEDILWQSVVEQQSQGTYMVHAELPACPSCTDEAIAEATEPRLCLSYFAATAANPDITLVIGRYLAEPNTPVAIFTTARTIPDFIAELKEQDSLQERLKLEKRECANQTG